MRKRKSSALEDLRRKKGIAAPSAAAPAAAHNTILSAIAAVGERPPTNASSIAAATEKEAPATGSADSVIPPSLATDAVTDATLARSAASTTASPAKEGNVTPASRKRFRKAADTADGELDDLAIVEECVFHSEWVLMLLFYGLSLCVSLMLPPQTATGSGSPAPAGR